MELEQERYDLGPFDALIKRIKETKMTYHQAMSEMNSIDGWYNYKDYEKREMAFRVGALWFKYNEAHKPKDILDQAWLKILLEPRKSLDGNGKGEAVRLVYIKRALAYAEYEIENNL